MTDNEQGEPGATTAIIDRSEFDAYLMLFGRVVVRRDEQTPALRPPATNTPARHQTHPPRRGIVSSSTMSQAGWRVSVIVR